jgi:hypothetical protein
VNPRLIAALTAVPVILTLGVALTAAAANTLDPACAPTAPLASPGTGSGVDEALNDTQRSNAQIIYTVGVQLGIPYRGEIIAIATALQESHLINHNVATDHDSLGLFQQRPSAGWGTPAQILNPVYASTAFYNRLRQVPDWQQLPLAQAAQAVQRSAFPDAYAKWEPMATQLASHVGSELGLAIPGDLEQCVSICPTITAGASGICVEAATVFGRAQSWLTAWSGGPVPYLSSGDPADWFEGYRRDCSGYVSMALGLDGPGLNTSELAARSTVIAKFDLQPGDLLINTAPDLRGHVVLFERWVDASMTSYYGYEQSGDGGTHHRIIPYSYFGNYPMTAYRLRMSTLNGG